VLASLKASCYHGCMKRILTGVAPSGNIHLGNYVGAIAPLLSLQTEPDTELFVFIADLHGLNQVQDPTLLRQYSRDIAAAYVASGLDAQNVTMFRQSDVSAHSELAIILSSITPLGMLERAHAYKDALANGKKVSLGLFAYPVLMAADILLYKADTVPVGDDQQQHIEYACDLAQKCNSLYGTSLALPQALKQSSGSLPGIDGRKMSKSYANTLPLFEDLAALEKKIMRIVTDSSLPSDPKDPENDTVFALHKALGTPNIHDLATAYRSGTISHHQSKQLLYEQLIRFLQPIQQKYQELTSNGSLLDAMLERGAERANTVAQSTLAEVRQAVGLR
jgi:tryptophanyl-tRNA synthetase